MSELDDLRVFGETRVGWCVATPPNETADAHGNPVIRKGGPGASDPRVPSRRLHDDPEVCALREHLRRHNGIQGLEIVDPSEVERAAEIFFRDGFVVVRDLLDSEMLARLRDGTARVLRQILEIEGRDGRKYVTETGRLPHRYSFGTASASRHMLHDPVWASLIDLPATTPILSRIFGGDGYWVIGAGGEVCLPGAIEYQALHADQPDSFQFSEERLEHARRMGILGETDNHLVRQRIIERSPPMVTINFLTSDLTFENGPIRQIPGTHGRPDRPPTPDNEPEWMRLSTLVGAKAGAGVFRDNRAWHGATPNVSREIRAIPNVEYGAPWREENVFMPSMPHEIWRSLSPHAQKISARIKTEPGVWPAGAGTMHPLASRREEAKRAGFR